MRRHRGESLDRVIEDVAVVHEFVPGRQKIDESDAFQDIQQVGLDRRGSAYDG
jgi:hypothetical protein